MSDKELIERYRYSFDNAYIGNLFQRYSHMLFGICLKYMKDEERAKDAVMEVFEKVLKDLKRHEVSNFRTWVYSVTKNYCLMQLRKDRTLDNRYEGFAYLSQQIMEEDVVEHLNDEDTQEETDKRLTRAIETLSEEQRECIRLFFFEKKSYDEIQTLTGFNYKQVKSFLQNGKRNLKIQMTRSK